MTQYSNFDGSQGVVVVSGYLGVSKDRQRSVSFWIRTTQEDLATICYWGHNLDPANNEDLSDGSENRVRLIGGYIELFGKGSRRRSALQVNDGTFHHVVCTWAVEDAAYGREDFQVSNIILDAVVENGQAVGQGKKIIFPDGTERSTTAINTPAQSEVIIGARPDGVGGYREFFQGDLDEFAVYNDVLSSGTILGAYNGGVRGADLLSLGQVPALQFWYRMGDDIGDVVPSGTLPFGTFVDQNPFTRRNAVVSSGITISG